MPYLEGKLCILLYLVLSANHSHSSITMARCSAAKETGNPDTNIEVTPEAQLQAAFA
jgi:hypothetical protein